MLIITPILISILFCLFNNENNNQNNNEMLTTILCLILILYFSPFINIFSIILYIFLFLFSIWSIFINHNYNNINNIIGLIFLIGCILSIISTNIISLFISIEILSLLMIILINLYIKDKYSGILYYIFSGIFSALFILAIGYLSIGYDIAYKFIYIIFYFKLGLAPFHILLFNIYNNISPIILILIDIPYKFILFFIIYRIHYIMPNGIFIIILGLIIGSLGSINYTNLINIMIYSSIFNYSIILLALHYNQFGYYFYYLIIYGISVLIYLYLINTKNVFLKNQSNLYKILWFIILLNLIGIPPLQGFFIKIFILFSILFPIFNNFQILLIFFFIFGILLFSYTYLRILFTFLLSNNINNYNNYNSNKLNNIIIPILIVLSTFPLFF